MPSDAGNQFENEIEVMLYIKHSVKCRKFMYYREIIVEAPAVKRGRSFYFAVQGFDSLGTSNCELAHAVIFKKFICSNYKPVTHLIV